MHTQAKQNNTKCHYVVLQHINSPNNKNVGKEYISKHTFDLINLRIQVLRATIRLQPFNPVRVHYVSLRKETHRATRNHVDVDKYNRKEKRGLMLFRLLFQ